MDRGTISDHSRRSKISLLSRLTGLQAVYAVVDLQGKAVIDVQTAHADMLPLNRITPDNSIKLG